MGVGVLRFPEPPPPTGFLSPPGTQEIHSALLPGGTLDKPLSSSMPQFSCLCQQGPQSPGNPGISSVLGVQAGVGVAVTHS